MEYSCRVHPLPSRTLAPVPSPCCTLCTPLHPVGGCCVHMVGGFAVCPAPLRCPTPRHKQAPMCGAPVSLDCASMPPPCSPLHPGPPPARVLWAPSSSAPATIASSLARTAPWTPSDSTPPPSCPPSSPPSSSDEHRACPPRVAGGRGTVWCTPPWVPSSCGSVGESARPCEPTLLDPAASVCPRWTPEQVRRGGGLGLPKARGTRG